MVTGIRNDQCTFDKLVYCDMKPQDIEWTYSLMIEYKSDEQSKSNRNKRELHTKPISLSRAISVCETKDE